METLRFITNRNSGRKYIFIIIRILILISCLLAAFILMPGASYAKEEKMTEVILDASWSMNDKLKGGETKISASKKAVENLLMRLDWNTIISFRAFGNQSSREKHDCMDTRVLTGFGQLNENMVKTLDQTNELKALGYAPIAYALSEAVKDFPSDFRGEMVVVLVSDGRETCQRDPCAVVQNLMIDRTTLVIHTIGFDVDDASRLQLECIAKSSGGKYFHAKDSSQLTKVLMTAVETPRAMIVRKTGEGRLTVEGVEQSGYSVTNSETGEKAGTITQLQPAIKLPSGIYTVAIGRALWKSVEVSPGETTVLKPAVLRIEHATVNGHKVVERETGEDQGLVSQMKDSIVLVPGEYEVYFGKTIWSVRVGQGAKILLKPGLVTVKGASPLGQRIRNMTGDIVETISPTMSSVPLPPGDYTIEIDGRQKPFTLKESENVIFQKK